MFWVYYARFWLWVLLLFMWMQLAYKLGLIGL